jgi:phosphatidylglycerophosphatase A
MIDMLPVSTIIGIVTSIVVTMLVSHYYFRRTIKKSIAVYLSLSSDIFEGIESSVREQLKFHFRNTEIRDLSQLEFMIINDGERAISGFIEPLSMELPKGVQVLDATIINRNPTELSVNVIQGMVSSDQSALTFDFPLLNKGEFFLVKLLLNGSLHPFDLEFHLLVDDLPRIIKPKRLFPVGNPIAPSVNRAAIAARSGRSAKDLIALAIATCGVGYLPIAPGTWGSLVGVGIYLLLQSGTFHLIDILATPNRRGLVSPWSVFLAVEVIVITIITFVGIWAATRTEMLLGRKDPGKVVIDEVAGQLIALLPVLPFAPGWLSIIAAFLLFRLFDIVKPYPARRLENLESGLGIMSDDLVAGAYAAVVTSVIIAIGLIVIN